MTPFDFGYDAGAAAGYMNPWMPTSMNMGITGGGPTDMFQQHLNMAGPNFGPAGGALPFVSLFSSMLGFQDPMAGGIFGGVGKFDPGRILAGQAYRGRIAGMKMSEEVRRSAANDYVRVQSILKGDEGMLMEDLNVLSKSDFANEEQRGLLQTFQKQSDAIRSQERKREIDSETANARLADLRATTKKTVIGAFEGARRGSDLYENRLKEYGLEFADRLASNPVAVGLIASGARAAGVGNVLDSQSGALRDVILRSAVAQFTTGGRMGAVDLVGESPEFMDEFRTKLTQSLDKNTEEGRARLRRGMSTADYMQVSQGMSERGMIRVTPGMTAQGDMMSGAAMSADRFVKMADSLKELEKIFGPDSDLVDIMASLEKISNSSLSGMSPASIRQWGNKLEVLSDVSNISAQDLVRLQVAGAQDSIRRGMGADIGVAAVNAGVMAGTSMRGELDGGGSGALSQPQVQEMFRKGSMEFATSRMGVALGNIAGAVLFKASANTGMSPTDLQAMPVSEQLKAAGLEGSEVGRILQSAYSPEGRTSKFREMFEVRNEADLVRRVSSSLGMSAADARSMLVSSNGAIEQKELSKIIEGNRLASNTLSGEFVREVGRAKGSLAGVATKIADEAQFGKADTLRQLRAERPMDLQVLEDAAGRVSGGNLTTFLRSQRGNDDAVRAARGAAELNTVLKNAGVGVEGAAEKLANAVFNDKGKSSIGEILRSTLGEIDVDSLREEDRSKIVGILGRDSGELGRLMERGGSGQFLAALKFKKKDAADPVDGDRSRSDTLTKAAGAASEAPDTAQGKKDQQPQRVEIDIQMADWLKEVLHYTVRWASGNVTGAKADPSGGGT